MSKTGNKNNLTKCWMSFHETIAPFPEPALYSLRCRNMRRFLTQCWKAIKIVKSIFLMFIIYEFFKNVGVSVKCGGENPGNKTTERLFSKRRKKPLHNYFILNTC